MILAIETSCDDTCAAVVGHGGEIHSNAIASQGLLHERYGGVVPEIASRHHLEALDAIVADALEGAGTSLDQIDLDISIARAGGFPSRCIVDSIVKMAPEEVAALPRRVRP